MTERQIWVQRPLYWGIERDVLPTGKTLTFAWLATTEAPYLYGKALRLRSGRTAYLLGLCRKAKKPLVRPTDTSAEEIRKWVY